MELNMMTNIHKVLVITTALWVIGEVAEFFMEEETSPQKVNFPDPIGKMAFEK
jgi:hypothetical protein